MKRPKFRSKQRDDSDDEDTTKVAVLRDQKKAKKKAPKKPSALSFGDDEEVCRRRTLFPVGTSERFAMWQETEEVFKVKKMKTSGSVVREKKT
jgi:hypothetical protein